MNYNWGEPKKNSKLTAIMMYVALLVYDMTCNR